MVKRGEIYMVDFNPARGSEQAGHRPALIIQNVRMMLVTVIARLQSLLL